CAASLGIARRRCALWRGGVEANTRSREVRAYRYWMSAQADQGGPMQSHSSHRPSIFCILPPHLLHEIANRGTPAQRSMALNPLASDPPLRFGRATYQLMATGAQKLMTPAPSVAEPQITIYDAHHRSRLPGSVVAHPSGSTDPEVKEAYAGLLATFN